ncbi:MAG: chorismate-binding protein [Thermoplasmatota archaeon]
MDRIELPWMEPIDAAAHFSGRLLDGQGAHPEARYAFMGLHPETCLRVENGACFIDGTRHGNVLGTVKAQLASRLQPSAPAPHPWTGGWMGYFAYEFVQHLEPTLRVHDSPLPDAVLEWFATGVVFDRRERTVTAYGSETNLAAVQQGWGTTTKNELHPVTWTPHTSQETYMQNVARMKEWIAEGDLFQANIATRFDADPVDPVAVFRHMATRNPSPYMCYLPYDDHTIVSNSPEQLFATENGHIRTRPIAGTRPRGQSHEQDKALASELRADSKEQAEHMMLVDLLRNDVSKVSEPGTTAVTEWMSVERYSHVMHLVSQVTGKLRADAGFLDCLAAIFPGGTITGAPKHRACMRIHETETVARGPYTGSAGCINHRGDAHFNIMIRTLTLADKSMVHAGAGIVMDSDPAREWAESLQKASAFLDRPGGSSDRLGEVEMQAEWKPPTPSGNTSARVLLVDNYDSFVHNLRDYCEAMGATTKVIRNDEDWQAARVAFRPTHIVLSPGPGHPVDSGATLAIAESNIEEPILGVCLGHQAMALASAGAIRVVPAVHGKTDHVQTSGPLFPGKTMQVARYHSLVADLPDGWIATATLADGTLMAMQRGNRHGVQFHPESMGTPDGMEVLRRFLAL